MEQSLVFDLDLINKYDKSGPRYTSYPTAVQFHDGFGEAEYRACAERTNQEQTLRPLSLYFHIPFCDTVCFYCGCNKVATKDRSKALPYLENLHKEIAMQGALFDRSRPVTQLHWGGGTPTFINHDQMRELMRVTGEHFNLSDDDSGEYSIEIDPREVQVDTIALLRELGFNRMSLGVQDFTPQVQKAVNRIQSDEETWGALREARRHGFKSISIDLIYGLPFQSVKSFAYTMEKAIELDSDRISLFNYAHLPSIFKPQRRINEADLPSAAEKLDILQMANEYLAKAGYVYIGMDHFAKPDDELAIAQREGSLYRNFQGYSTQADCDLIGMGSTSIGKVGNTYSQNMRTLDEYYERIGNGQLAVFRGIELNTDDLLRRDIITELMCNFRLDMRAVEQRNSINFSTYFEQELKALEQMASDGLIDLEAQTIIVRPAGRMLIRNVCMVFDRYLHDASEQRFSKVI
ncbi:MAG: oxygen-independent coproporphyrinogen III oxidase [Gammaproteobacteria bacterium]|nr:oxygen-independent coproporphyrinogen III oxidase [Gammaproteobacteria bacterium]